jgi:hypothetical protein
MNSKYFLAISLAIIATAISAAPAGAVIIAPGSQLRFSGEVLNTSGTIDSAALGNTFQGTFATGGGNITRATGTFASIFAGVGPTTTATGLKFSTSNSVSFEQVGPSSTVVGIDYLPTTDLVFIFPNTNGTSADPAGGTLTLPANTRFLVTPAISSGTGSRSSFNIYTTPSFGGTFTNGSNTTNLNFTSFSFDVDNFDSTNPVNISPDGSFSFVATVPDATAVPEPFTIIGTILGGTAAMRMRKKLAAVAKN